MICTPRVTRRDAPRSVQTRCDTSRPCPARAATRGATPRHTAPCPQPSVLLSRPSRCPPSGPPSGRPSKADSTLGFEAGWAGRPAQSAAAAVGRRRQRLHAGCSRLPGPFTSELTPQAARYHSRAAVHLALPGRPASLVAGPARQNALSSGRPHLPWQKMACASAPYRPTPAARDGAQGAGTCRWAGDAWGTCGIAPRRERRQAGRRRAR